jgi:hypothetical protein
MFGSVATEHFNITGGHNDHENLTDHASDSLTSDG